MKGIVDDELRALLEIQVANGPNGPNVPKSTVLVWVDTAFNGGLVLPREEIERLGLQEYSSPLRFTQLFKFFFTYTEPRDWQVLTKLRIPKQTTLSQLSVREDSAVAE